MCVSGHARDQAVADSQRNERRTCENGHPGVWTQAKRDRFLAHRRDAVDAHSSFERGSRTQTAEADSGGTLAHLADQIAALEERLATKARTPRSSATSSADARAR